MERIRFGPFELDAASGELRRGGDRVRLPLQPLRALHHLALRSGEVVSREELKDHVWGAGVVVDYETGINTLVRQIRRALDDDTATPTYLETLPKRGYRFLPPIEIVPPPPPPGLVTSEVVSPVRPERQPRVEAAPAPRRRRFTTLHATAALLALLAVGAVVALSGAGRAPRRPVVVAVLPFANLTGDSALEYLADGLTDDVINHLSTLQPTCVAVIARTSAMAYRETKEPVTRIARELGADLVLEGSLRRSASALRVTSRLVRASGDTVAGALDEAENVAPAAAASGHAAAADLAGVEARLARGIARAVAVPFRADVAPDDSPATRDLVLRARFLMNRRGPASADAAVALLEDATRRSPASAAAHAGLAEALLSRAMEAPRARDLRHAREAARRALEIAPRDPVAWAVVATLRLHVDWDAAGADQAWRRSLEADPGRAESHHARAACLAALGRHEDALDEVREAQRLDPLNPSVIADVGWHSHLARRFEQAAREFRATLSLGDLEDWMFEWTIVNDVARARPDEAMPVLVRLLEKRGAEDELEEVRQLPPARAVAYHLRARADQLARLESGRPGAALGLAVDLALLGDHDAALSALERAAEARAFWLPPIVAAAPAFDSLRGDPRFARLLERTTSGRGDRANARVAFRTR